MRFLRRKFLLRSFSIFSLIVFLNSLAYPLETFALTTGPHQPEYTSYESPGATDMVNLLTGDFTFNLPLIDVPIGDDGSFSIPLTYHAGIGPDQEASWVGLGFNVNVGAITRSVNGFPDDASGESQTVNVKDLTGRRGWNANFMGSSLGWDSEIGHYGVISLGDVVKVAYDDNGLSSVGIAGLNISGSGARFNAGEFMVVAYKVVMAVATYGATKVADLALTIAMQVATEIAMDMVMPDYTPNVATSGYWKYSQEKDKDLFHTNYWIWLDQTRIEDMYGILHLDKGSHLASSGSNYQQADVHVKVINNINSVRQAVTKQFPKSTSTHNKGSASDISINLASSANYWENTSPTVLATDNFSVSGPGISGSIKPYRLEVGSVSVPREMTSRHTRLNPVPFQDYGAEKVPFIYEGANANRYYHHVGSATNVTSPNFYFGITSNKETGTATTYANKDVLRYDLVDGTFAAAQRIRADVATRKKLPQGHYVHWLTNSEIQASTGKFSSSAYMDYFQGSARGNFRSNYSFGGRVPYYGNSATSGVINLQTGSGVAFTTLDLVDVNVYKFTGPPESEVETVQSFSNLQVTAKSGDQITVNNNTITLIDARDYVEVISKKQPKASHSIGGFVITVADGMNYHYALPVYDYDFYTKTTDLADPQKYSTISRHGQFANTWLLTAITGPDFIDRGGSNQAGDGYIDENDWGYWIKFNYGRHSSDHMWRLPYTGAKRDAANLYESFAQGYKEVFYLNSVESRSHVALFIKDTRRDSKDARGVGKRSSLRLAEIALLTRDAYKTLTNPATAQPNRLSSCSGVIDVMYTSSGSNTDHVVNGTKATFIQSNALRRVVFNNNNYTLCTGSPNSDPGYGKLTLQSLSILGRNNTKIMPDYKFTYAHNPAYDYNKWDGWGMYSSSGTSSGTSHKASATDSDGWAWSLASIKSPLGNSIDIQYERDTYSSISGEKAYSGVSTSFGYNLGDATVEGDILANKIRVSSTTGFAVGDKVEVSGHVEYKCAAAAPISIIDYKNDLVITAISGNYITMEGFSYTGIPCLVSYLNVELNTGLIKKFNRKGGNIRVSSITLNDNSGQQYKTRYLYDDNGKSSGVVSVEPDYIRTSDNDFPFYKWLGYSASPVLYGKVTVLTGKLADDADFHTRQVFEFETPHTSLYTTNSAPVVKNKELISSYQLLGSKNDYSTVL